MDALTELIKTLMPIGLSAWLFNSFSKRLDKIEDVEKRVFRIEIERENEKKGK